MKPYTEQEIEHVGFFSSLLGGKPTKNTWAEINNLLVQAETADEVTAEQVKKACKQWGAKCNDESLEPRAAIFRKLAERAYAEAKAKDDALFAQVDHLAAILELPELQVKLATKAAKTAAYFTRCRQILEDTEALTIQEIDTLFDYDYEDGFPARKQVFYDYFNLQFEAISRKRRYSYEDEDKYRQDCEKLNIPYEFRNNLQQALDHYRDLWCAETQPLGHMDIQVPLREGEFCLSYANCGFVEFKEVEKVDDYFELTRKFKIEETVTFSDDKLEMPKFKEAENILTELGYFFVTNQRVFGLAKEHVREIALADITSIDPVKNAMITFHTKNQGDMIFKYPDDAAEVLYLVVQRVLKGEF